MSRGSMNSAEGLDVEGTATGESMRRVVFAGSPNCGKTTLFNRITGLRAKTANYPGTTVEVRRAFRRVEGRNVEFVDLPGLYGLCGDSPEEAVAARFLSETPAAGNAETLVVLVVDATRLGRQLYLVREVRERAGEMVVALNMTDLAEREGIRCDIDTLAQELGVPVIPLSARTGAGVRDLKQRIADWRRCDCPKGALRKPLGSALKIKFYCHQLEVEGRPEAVFDVPARFFLRHRGFVRRCSRTFAPRHERYPVAQPPRQVL